jgi:hypothetical protein
MPVSSTKRALLAVAAMLVVIGAALGAYFYFQHQPPGSPSAGAAPDLLGLLPADAPVIAYADVAALRRVASSPLGAVLGLASPGPQADKDYADFVRDTGFDYTRDLDRAAIAAWPSALGTPAGQAPIGRLLALGDGRFDRHKIEAYMLRTGRVAQTSPQLIYQAPGQSPGENIFVAFVTGSQIALATDMDLLTALAGGGKHARNPSMQARIERVAGAPIFAVAATDKLPNSVYAQLSGSPQLQKLARSIKSLTLAAKPDGENLNVALDGECDSMKNAFQLSVMIDGARMIGSAALSDPKNRRQMTREQYAFLSALLSSVNVNHQDKWVRVTLALTPEMLGVGSANPHAAAAR